MIDFSRAPEGATHYLVTKEITWYKATPHVVLLWVNSRWLPVTPSLQNLKVKPFQIPESK